MSRLIDADRLRRWIEGECKSPSIPSNEAAFGKRILMHMEVMESEDVQHVAHGEWIPCVDGNEPKANAECWISTNAKYVRRAIYAPEANNQPNGFIVTVGSFGFYEYGKSAKAWMPYTQEPEPYREEGE